MIERKVNQLYGFRVGICTRVGMQDDTTINRNDIFVSALLNCAFALLSFISHPSIFGGLTDGWISNFKLDQV